MISLQNVSLQRGTKPLLVAAGLRVQQGQKVGLIGPNGSGKSSLFQLLQGRLHHDSGDCSVPQQWRIAHMAQEIGASDATALDFVLDGDMQLRRLERRIAAGDDDGADLAALYAQMEDIQGYAAPARAQQLLNGLGFLPAEAHRAVADFSGGWRIRLNLAQALMCPSDLLLLDEPTNHLDLDATVWLEQWLQRYQGTLLIISHDREFLDNVVNHIVSVEQQQLVSYPGNYSAFERQRAERLAQQQAVFEKQQQRIADIENFVRRFRAKASKARQAQSRLKELQRMEQIAPAHIDSPFNFSIPNAEKISNPLLSLVDADIGYGHDDGGRRVLERINLSIVPDTRIGLLGPNGAGKSTLIKTLAAHLPTLAGDRIAGEHLHIGYFAQHQLQALDLGASAALHLQRLSPRTREQAIRTYLGSFGFLGDRAFETIRHFSGGEKARLALALICWQKPNLLLLDEPTNHLDLEMRHALTLALQTFAGAVIVVSHDRHLLRNCADEFMLVDAGSLEPFTGDLADYERWLAQRQTRRQRPEATPAAAATESAGTDRRRQRQQAAARRQALQPLAQAVKRLERDMEKITRRLAALEQKLADPAIYQTDQSHNPQLRDWLKEQTQLRQELAQLEENWLASSEELEQKQAAT
ncbi:ATP-binding cassette domain-containing protein [Exilibacterium tricleocarpae]|uniref:Probable ATP-binding protein YheS n=1 Tax=Exilibacterium tricleocarpae TaxID=2591008 RepID=A0A545TZ87_9GAMM|nr:ATP-binding cassette domain-containing protein [Exilibacterium tricleocarpae]TQV82525.1 ATP-binding cassette domain-containing protein [Exilibacterium tricleocarpae]